MARVKLTDVAKVYSTGLRAVDRIDLTVEDREFMVLVGPSGCGKSTLLRMIAGLEIVTEGAIELGDRVVNDLPPKDRNIAMVFQNYALFPHMTVFDNIGFGLKLRRVPKRDIKLKVEETARLLGIEELLGRRPKALSGGQRQRVALGRAIVRRPAVFLLDEPLSNLDARMRITMRKELKMLHQRLQATMIYVTHDQVEAMTLGERICVMNDGRMQQVGTPLEVYDRPANRFVPGFIGTPQMNLFEGELAIENGAAGFRNAGVSLALGGALADAASRHGADAAVTFGFRPEGAGLLSGDSGRGGGVFDASVEVVESLGDEQLIYCTVNEIPFTLKVDAHRPVNAGDAVRVQIDMQRSHIFAGDDGVRVV